jgi:hypothetical protein
MFNFSLLFALLLSLHIGSALAAEKEYLYHQTAKCCDKIDDSEALVNCIKIANLRNKDIAIVTYASSDIVDYAAYAFAVNSAYAEQNGYEMYFLNEAGGANYEPRDAR